MTASGGWPAGSSAGCLWSTSSRSRPTPSTLDTLAAVPSFGRGPVSLRWITVHMIEETARHAGHVDLLHDALFAC